VNNIPYGSGGSIIGDIKPLNVDDTNGLFVVSGQSWLRSGIVDDNVSSYPEAKQSGDPAYVGIASQDFDSSTGLPIYVRIK
jgi:hypothetical protein